MNPTEFPSSEPPRSAAPPPAPVASAGPKRIYRDPRGPIGGVAGGFAGYFDVDPVIARLLWIVALLSGIGGPAYLVCWIVIPKAKAWPPPGYGSPLSASSPQGTTALVSGFVIIALAAVIGAGTDGVGQYLLPAALIGFGVYLLNQRAAEGGAATLAEPGAPVAPFEPELEHAARASSYEARYARPSDPVSSRRARLVTPTVLSVLALGAGIAAALHSAGIVSVSIAGAAAVGLVIVGVALLGSLWLGRARGLIPLGLGLMIVMLAADKVGSWFAPHEGTRSLDALGVHVDVDGGAVGDQSFTPTSLAALERDYKLGVGKLTLDLSHVDFAGATRQLDVKVGVGEALVIVPADTSVEVHGNVGIGDALALGEETGGLGARVTKSEDTGPAAGQLEPAAGKLIIDFTVGIGKGEVQRAPAAE
jgi:phage shock protein PspC (stress-responsive transcriptional regulator)